jgi:photosystem II stability/assembly factor-like uncharacterized protein
MMEVFMKTLLFFSLAIALLISPLSAQDWQTVKEGNVQYLPNNGFFLDANTGWLVCDDGVVLKTTDGGDTWTTTQIPDALGYDLEDVEFADADTGYACSNDGFIYKTTDGGAIWSMIGDTANYVVDIAGLSVVDANLVYFCGDDSTLLKTEDGGESYTRSSYNFQNEDLDGGVHFISPDVGVVISDANAGETWYTHDGGQNWEFVQILFPPATISSRLYDVSGAGDGVFAIAAYHRITFISVDSGQTYQASGDVEYGYDYFNCVQVLDNNTIMTSGSDGFLVGTDDGGANWDTLYVGSGQTGVFHQFVDSNNGYMFLNSGNWKKTIDGGSTWSSLNEWPTQSLWGLALASENDIFVTSWGGGELTESHDGGETWNYPDNYKTMTAENLYECEFTDVSNGIIGGGSGTLRRTTDGGATWAFVDNPMYQQANKHINSLRYMNADTVFAGGSSGIIMRSDDGGETWTELENEGSSTVYDIWPVNENLIIASASSGQIYLSNTTLDTFHTANDYGTMSMRAVEFRKDVGIVVASSGYIYRTTVDEVDTLYEVFVDPDGDDMYDVEFVTDSIAYVVGENGKIYKTEDTGLTWTAETSQVVETLQKVAYGNYILWAVGQNATILKLDLTEAMSIETAEWQVVGTYHLAQNYPNPFNPATTINFILKKAGPVELEIYNIQGQKVATLVDAEMKAGAHSVTWNGSNLASGVYFYKLNSGDFTDVKKMMLLK